ncbi:serine/threonine-protein kinase [Streptomyces katrae]|uniref:Serine/threonine-protein kinase n=1 Tax=Streptomyces katrae TaxID=68223 RepID=A0ABT7GL30_9ACTN|nr:serine/threonine-protein kinase [Streptomyces katrae]MDK9494285.1 serine/threonine-protein kinase [Streptomyces katrae]
MSVQPYGVQPAHEALSADDPREIGGYRLHARLGSGGMGEVYLAHTPGGRPIALKAIRREFAADPAFRERFAREVASARRIHGLFTAQVVDFGVDERTPWLATAYVPGPSLDEVVRRHGPLPVRTVLLLVAGVAEALQAIHGAGVVHRDLKPANVLLAGDGPRVIDFGIAHAAGSAALTGTGLRIGTAAFMAPEQALGRPVTAATDVFALGALTAYVAGGQPPFGGGPESTALYRVVHEHPDLSGVPAELEQLVRWCLAKEPADRPTTAELIGYVHAHPGVGPRPEFTEGWLPRPVREEVGAGRDAVRPAPPAPHAPTAPAAPAPAAPVRLPAPTPVPPPAPAPVPEADGGRRARRRGRGRLPAVAAAVAVTLAACGAALYWFDTGEPDGGGADGFVPGYTGARLTAPDSGYEFDLEAGKVVPADTATWYLAPEGRSFVPSESSDVHLAEGAAPTPADCERGIGTKPVTALPFSALGERRPFCVRSPDRNRIVVVRLVEAAADGSVTILVDQYHRE